MRPGVRPTHVECLRRNRQYQLAVGMQVVPEDSAYLGTDQSIHLASRMSQLQLDECARAFNGWSSDQFRNMQPYNPRGADRLLGEGGWRDTIETDRHWNRPANGLSKGIQVGNPASEVALPVEAYQPVDPQDEWYAAVENCPEALFSPDQEILLHREFMEVVKHRYPRVADQVVIACRFFRTTLRGLVQ